MTQTATSSEQAPLQILLVEDNPGDVHLAQKAIAKMTLKTHLTVANDGAQALAAINKQGGFTDIETPNLILLDLNLPRMHGHEILKEFKKNPNSEAIPVAILSSSTDEGDVETSKTLGALDYFVKPKDIDELKALAEKIESFWNSWLQTTK